MTTLFNYAPQRWHLVRKGRIVATAWTSDGDAAERELRPGPADLLIADDEWWERHWRRALLDWKRRTR